MNIFESRENVKTVNLGERLRNEFSRQAQYLVRYFDEECCEVEGKQFLGAGLTIKGNAGNYHDMTIAENDLPEAIRRLREVLPDGSHDQQRGKKDDERSEVDISLLPPWARGE